MKKLFLFSLAAAGMLVTSCQDYEPWDGDVAKYEYRKEFKEHFGNIDFSNTWNFAEQQAVFVSPGSSQDVKIYAKTDGVYTLAGSFTGIDHAQWLYVDVVAGTTELSVVNGHRSIETFVGGEANFAATRAYLPNTGGLVSVTKNTDESKYRYFEVDKAIEYERLLPSGTNNRGRLSENFFYVSRGPFMLYPQSWGAGDNDVIGIYYYGDNGQPVRVPIFELNGSDNDDKPTLYYQTAGGNYILNTDYIPYYKFATFPDEKRGNWGGTKDPNCTKQCSYGYLVDIPEGMEFGIYVENKSKRTTAYSENQLNNSNWSMAVTFTMDGELYVAMEDCYPNNSDNDLNDIVICFGPPTLPIIHDEDILKWVLCFEDLGNTFDIDYNDVVIGVTNPVDNMVTVTPLAAGGTLASYVFYGNDPIGSSTDADDGEIHGMFGFPKATSGQYTPINVSADQRTFDTGINRKVDVGSNNYTLAAYAVGGTEAVIGSQKNMGGFYVKVVPSGDQATVQNATRNGQKIAPSTLRNIENGAMNYENVPYVFCVPHRWRDSDTQPFTYFRWSKEMIPMTTSYADPGHSFADWVGNKAQAVDWYRHPKESTTLTDHENHTYYPEISEDERPNDQNHSVTYCPSYEYEKCLINRDEIITTSGSHESNSNVSAYELEIPKADLHIVHHNEIGTDGKNHSEVIHNLTDYPSLTIALVATGLRKSGDRLNLRLYRKKGETKTLISEKVIDYASSKAIHGNDADADYVDITMKPATDNPSWSWNDVDYLVVEVAEHSASIHLNSIWTAMPHEDFHVMPLAEISNTLDSDNSEATVALAFVGAAHHVVDYTNGNNGWRSFTTYAVMLSQIENAGRMNSSPILYTLVRKSAGHYVLKNPRGGYLKAPTANNQKHEWGAENEAADLVIESSPDAQLMAGCTSGSTGDAVSIKTTVGNTTYYFSANKPAMWRTSATDYQKAIYLFHWEGNH